MKKISKYIFLTIASFLGAGFFPWASGTLASGLALLPYWLLYKTPGIYLGITAGLLVIGVWCSQEAEKILKLKDPHAVVIDEVVGMLIAALWLPPTGDYLLSAFLLFRLFDIWKPFPIYQLQRLPGGWGIMADDVLAGIYTNVILQVFAHWV